jgi:hypothetical protein
MNATLVIDAGSPGNLGWADSSGKSGGADTLRDAVDRLGVALRAGSRAALGIEAPLWTPRRTDIRTITKARDGEGSRAWSQQTGACAMAAGLGGMGFVFGRLSGLTATVRPDRWRDGSLLIWEAFVSGVGKTKGRTHEDDARAALSAFDQRRSNLASDLKREDAINLAVAAARTAGLFIDVDELGEPALVVKALGHLA